MASTPEFEPGPHWRKASALTIAPPLLPRSIIHIKKKLLERWNIRIYLFRTTVQPPVGDQPKVDPRRIPSENGSPKVYFLEENLLSLKVLCMLCVTCILLDNQIVTKVVIRVRRRLRVVWSNPVWKFRVWKWTDMAAVQYPSLASIPQEKGQDNSSVDF